MKYNICLVSPDKSISNSTAEVVKELGDDLRCDLEIIDGNVKTAVQNVKPYIEKGVDAIISRGGTAIALMKAYPQIPVVAIQIEATDILKALRNIPAGTRIGFISYSEIIYQYKTLEEILGVQKIKFFRLFHLGDEDKLIEKYVCDAKEQGIEVLIGSIHVRQYARKYHLGFVFLESGKGAILRAIREAASMILVRNHERDDFKIISNIVDYTLNGAAVFDRDGTLQKWNPAFASMFLDVLGKDWQEQIPLIFDKSRLKDVLKGESIRDNEIIQVKNREFAVIWQPVWELNSIVRVIAFIQPVEQLQPYVQSVRKKQRGSGLIARYTLEDIIGKSVAMRRVKEEAVKYANTLSTVLITGESGTGKEMIAQAIHNLSPRKHGPFVAINCGAFTESLLESELFGYEEGTFTGAKKGGKVGVFELAEGGTLFLDEIGDMPYVLQNRLLRVLQERAIMRVGGNKVIPVDVRIIAATNQALEQDIKEHRFRLDLYYRLNVLRIKMPALRERKGDIALLAQVFLSDLNRRYGRHKQFDESVLQYFAQQEWKGNVRQLSNIVERLVLLSEKSHITMNDVVEALDIQVPVNTEMAEDIDIKTMEDLLSEGKNYGEIAEIMGVSRSTLWRHRRKEKNKQIQ